MWTELAPEFLKFSDLSQVFEVKDTYSLSCIWNFLDFTNKSKTILIPKDYLEECVETIMRHFSEDDYGICEIPFWFIFKNYLITSLNGRDGMDKIKSASLSPILVIRVQTIFSELLEKCKNNQSDFAPEKNKTFAVLLNMLSDKIPEDGKDDCVIDLETESKLELIKELQ
jgi:hypothetical protein